MLILVQTKEEADRAISRMERLFKAGVLSLIVGIIAITVGIWFTYVPMTLMGVIFLLAGIFSLDISLCSAVVWKVLG